MSKRDHGDGGIDERGPNCYRLRWRVYGKRFSKSFRGSIGEARKELRRLLKSADDGVHVAPAKLTVAQNLKEWLDTEPVIGIKGKILSPKSLERYRQLRDEQIIPHLVSTLLQSLKPAQVHRWHSTLLGSGGTSGRPLTPRTVGHAHRLLHGGLERAVKLELVARNVAHAIHPTTS